MKRICETCGKEFDTPLWSIKKGWGKYCSRECKEKAQSIKFRGEHHPSWKGGPLKLTCEFCGKEFDAHPSKKAKYCSRGCSYKAQSIKYRGKDHHSWKGGSVKRTCEFCGNEFNVNIGRIKRGKGKYCSIGCCNKARSVKQRGEHHPNWKGGLIKRTCGFCGKEFAAHPSKIKRGLSKYCSRVCHWKANSTNYSGENNPSWKGGPLKRTCEICGKEFKIRRYHSKMKHAGKYCSKECFGKGHSFAIRGELNPTWRGGASFFPYCHLFTRRMRDRVRAYWRDNFGDFCLICGKPMDYAKLSVHHVFFDKLACCHIDNLKQLLSLTDEEIKDIENAESPLLELAKIYKLTPDKLAEIEEEKLLDTAIMDQYGVPEHYRPMFLPLCPSCHTRTTRGDREYWKHKLCQNVLWLTGGKSFYTDEEFISRSTGNIE